MPHFWKGNKHTQEKMDFHLLFVGMSILVGVSGFSAPPCSYVAYIVPKIYEFDLFVMTSLYKWF